MEEKIYKVVRRADGTEPVGTPLIQVYVEENLRAVEIFNVFFSHVDCLL